MLDKVKLMYLNKEQNYEEIYNIFINEYEDLIIKFLTLNNISCYDKAPISYYIGLLEQNFKDEYKEIVYILKSIFINERIDNKSKIMYAIEEYNDIAKRLKV